MSKPISKFPQLPCIILKCLKYPICRHRIEIECNELLAYRAKLSLNDYLYTSGSIWFKINKILPNLEKLMYSELIIDHRGKEKLEQRVHINSALYRRRHVV